MSSPQPHKSYLPFLSFPYPIFNMFFCYLEDKNKTTGTRFGWQIATQRIWSSIFLICKACPILVLKVSPCWKPRWLVTLLANLTCYSKSKREGNVSFVLQEHFLACVSCSFRPLLNHIFTFLLTSPLTGLISVSPSGNHFSSKFLTYSSRLR